MILTEFSYSQGLWCLDSSCTSCTQGYLYRNHKCLALCPTGYTTSGKICNESSSTLLFSMTTGIPLAFNSRSVNFFYHPSGLEFRDPGKLSPIMTKDRGLYFTSQSTLVSNTSWILSPNFVISYSLRVINEGVVFKITHGNQVILELSASPTTFSSKIFVYSSSLNTTVNLNTIHLDQWVILNFYVNQLSSVLRVIINDKDLYLDKYEFRSQIKSLKYTFGDSTSYSFTGFLYDGFFNNYYENYKNIYFSEIMCGYNEYYFNEACLPCSPSCSDWPWCTRSSCNICYYPSCNSCSDFLISSCTSCSSNTVPYCELGSNCAEGTELICNTCENGFVNIKGVCVLSPYKYDSSNLITPVINTKFNEFKQFYDIFQSGNNSLTYLPFNNGDKDDPNPIKGRGMNFISGEVNYLRSSTKIIIGPEFTIAVWIYAHKNGYFFEKDTIKWFTNGKFMIELSSKEESSLINSLNLPESLWKWRFFSISTKIDSSSTYFYLKRDTYYLLTHIVKGRFFYDTDSYAYVGNYQASSFFGMIYSITIWQTFINDFSNEYEPCGLGLGITCIGTCGPNHYYSEMEKGCRNCNINCNKGCGTFGTCIQCIQVNCTNCSSYEKDSICYKYGNTYCEKGLKISSRGECCSPSCLTCYGQLSFKCYSCLSKDILLGTVCTSSCPLGFANISNVCTLVDTKIIDVTFNQISPTIMSTINNLNFAVSNKTLFYPLYSIYNPIPAKDRGFYFGKNSSVSSDSNNISYNLTINIWIYCIEEGKILNRGALLITTNNITVKTESFNYQKAVTNQWQVFNFQMITQFDGLFMLNLGNDGVFAYLQRNLSNLIYNENSFPFILGNAVGGFKGFIFRLTTYNGVINESPYTETLSTCTIQTYPDSNSCSSCLDSCQNGCVINKSCNLCSSPLCESCLDFSSTSCTKCSSISTLILGECICLNGTYYNSSKSTCDSCPSLCSTCSNLISCLTCIENSSLSNKICSCIDGFYFDEIISSCFKCHNECKTCSGPLNTNCLLCNDNAKLNGDGSCLCDVGFYMDLGLCEKCHGLCEKCNSLNDCLICKDVSVVQSGVCQCPNGLFPDYFIGTCKSCDSKCLTCSDTSGSTCTSCDIDLTLVDNTCICNSGLFWNEKLSKCSQCGQLCSDCLSFTICTKCKENSDNISGICYCKNGYYKNSLVIPSCTICHETCLTCSGPSSTHCTSCKLNSSLNQNSECICDTKFFMSSGICTACSTNCLTCSSTSCLICDSTSLLISGNCQCKQGYFSKSLQDSCQKCHSKCKNCFDINENSCIDCKINSYLNTSNCFCSKGFFWNDLNENCDSCDGLCLRCSDLISCTECKSNSKLSEGTCVCLQGFFRDESSLSCLDCDISCIECDGPGEYDCVKCKLNEKLMDDGSCQCADGFFFNHSKGVCLSCSLICKTCYGSDSTCTSCPSNFYLSSSTCKCIQGFYLNSQSCLPCDSSCKSCRGPLPTDCESCRSKSSLTSTSSCLCIQGYYLQSGKCQQCHSTCASCSSSQESDCESCREGLKLLETGFCKCESPRYWDSKYEVCRLCSEFCLQCNLFSLSGCELCSDDCFFCQNHSVYINGTCECIDGFYKDERIEECFKCHKDCKTCFDGLYYTCSSCEGVLDGGVCLDRCPLGYEEKMGSCQVKGGDGKVFKIVFDYFSDGYEDDSTGIYFHEAEVDGLDLSAPKSVYKRGLYFNGMNSTYNLDSSLPKSVILSQELFLSFWINSLSPSGCIFSSSSTSSPEISLTLTSSTLAFSLIIGSNSFSDSHSDPIPIKNWTFIGIILSHSSPTSVSLLINFSQKTFSELSSEPFSITPNSTILIGLDRFNQIFFNGFIYSIELRRKFIEFGSFISSTCNGCSICLDDGNCIGLCKINEVYDEDKDLCYECKELCENECRYKDSCNLCADKVCKDCQGFEEGECVECESGFEVRNGKCEKCSDGRFFDSETRTCMECARLCRTCEGKDKCLSCESNAEVLGTVCVCSLGYFSSDSVCVRNLFYAKIKLFQNNSAQVNFSEPLSQNLSQSSLQAFYNQQSCDFTISLVSSTRSTYLIICALPSSIPKSSSLLISFPSPLISTYNSLLATKNLSVSLFPTSISTTEVKITEAKSFATKGTTVGASVSLCLSIASFDVSSLFSFVNFAEIFSVISLYGLDLPEEILEFLRSVRVQKSLPNIFESFNIKNLKIKLDQRLVKYGYKSNSVFINSGPSMLIFFIIVVCFFIVKVLGRLLKSKVKKIEMVQEYFHYGVFLKFWLQTSLDFWITLVNALFHGFFKDWFFVFDYFSSVLILVWFK